MESRSYFKNQKSTPDKFRIITAQIKGLNPVQATKKLETMNKKAAGLLNKMVKSAIVNAKQTLKVDESMLEFKLLTIEEGQKLKRFRPTSRGMAKAFLRRMSHVKIILTPRKVEENEKPEKETVKPAKKAAPVKAAKKVEPKEQKKEVEVVTEEK